MHLASLLNDMCSWYCCFMFGNNFESVNMWALFIHVKRTVHACRVLERQIASSARTSWPYGRFTFIE